MDLGLHGAAVCVAGGTRGLGLATATLFAAEGARVAVVGRDGAAVDRAVDAMRAGGAESVGVAADLTDAAAVGAVFDTLAARWGVLNVLVNAAGPPTRPDRWYDVADADWSEAYETGVVGAIRALRAALPLLRAAGWARIVNVGAMSTRHPSAHRTAYTAAKAALAMATKQISMDLAPEQILVNTVSPGAMLTERLRARLGGDVNPDDPFAVMNWMRVRSGFASQTGRVGDPADVARLVVFLASPANGYVTGADVNADGGSLFR